MMHLLGISLFAGIALFWLFYGIRVAYGATRLPWIKDFAPAADAECPTISLLFAARDEEEKLPVALETLAKIDYPKLEIVAVDDRSVDATGGLLDEFAAANPRLRAVHVAELPAGWLGKTHALQQAFEHSTGEWLVFTDADVRFAPDVLRRAISVAKHGGLDHLTLFGDVDMVGFWETVLITFFGLGFNLSTDPARVSDPESRSYVGVGAFQMLRRSAYEAAGTHRRLAMEVVDDMKLGKIVKQAGFRSGVAVAQDSVVVRWQAGLGNLVRGVTKNFFAGAGYRVSVVVVQLLGLFLFNIVPFLGVIFGTGWIRTLSAVAAAVALTFHGGVAWVMRVSPFYALTHPVGAALFMYMLARSTVVTLWQGGVEWRGTFYSLAELRRGVV
jgi:glycosyltransferase involved in cell wall biosynthesis